MKTFATKLSSIFLPILFICIFAQAQVTGGNTFPASGSVGLGTTAPKPSSLLDMESTTQGFLIPRMTTAQRNAIKTPVRGLMIFQTDGTIPGFYFYNGSIWTSMASNGWKLTGNAGTNPSVDFLGTTDAEPLVFKVNKIQAAYLDYTGNFNAAFGYKSLLQNTTGYYNTAMGYAALITNKSGSRNTAIGNFALSFDTVDNNTAIGTYALENNTNGLDNVATGTASLSSNMSGSDNTATGVNSLATNTTGYSNSAVGYLSLFTNNSGYNNTATGTAALYSNTTGSYNTANGTDALYYNNIGANNTALGEASLYQNTTGSFNSADGGALSANTSGDYNTAMGSGNLSGNQTGSYNTGVGANANVSGSDFTNSSVFGYGAMATASDQVRVANEIITSIGGDVSWSNVSDGRVKKNIKQNVPGLAFINKLQPITYNLDLDAADKITQPPVHKDAKGNVIPVSQWEFEGRKNKEQILYTGFIAQDVEQVAKSLNYDFSGVDAAKNSKDLYGLRYAEFVVPLVKGEQELSTQNDSLKQTNASLQLQIDELKIMVHTLANKIGITLPSGNVSLSSASLEQNAPNPFAGSTIIGYTLPQTYTSAQISIRDNSGRTLKAITVSGNGKSSVNLDAASLSGGAYSYTLVVDGRIIDTKQMVLAK